MKKISLFLLSLSSFVLAAAPATQKEAAKQAAPAKSKEVKKQAASQSGKKAKRTAPKLNIICTPASHVVKEGETVKFAITSTSDKPISVVISLDGSDQKIFKTLTVKSPAVVTSSLSYPGFLMCTARSYGAVARQAVAVAPEKIRYARKAPADFDKFWEDSFKEAAKLPLDLKAEPINPNPDYNSFILSCANVNGKRAYAFYAAPKKVKGKIPLMVYFGGGEAYAAGAPYPGKAIQLARRFKQPMAVLYFHLPPYRPAMTWQEARTIHKKFLKELGLRRYIIINYKDPSPKKFYAYPTIHGCLRLLNAVAERPEIDKTKVLFSGASHGGKIGAYIAAFFPLKAAFLGVPSSCEINAHLEGRYGSAAKEWKNNWKVTDYFDLVYFAPRIKCPVLVTAGYIDRSCPPTGVYSFYNAIPEGKKTFFAKIRNGHGDSPEGYNEMINKYLIDQLADKK